mmetsp:Transcript_22073/g.38121  ORF Transcript_22073/g.38121 Transcript_22073/m.38121 type:complete len:479 (+) Transcript_22073:650-2086(+)
MSKGNMECRLVNSMEEPCDSNSANPETNLDARIEQLIESRKERGLFRSMWPSYGVMFHGDNDVSVDSNANEACDKQPQFDEAEYADFASNDYLGLTRNPALQRSIAQRCLRAANQSHVRFGGSGGSRVLSGNSLDAEMLEKRIADFHKAKYALLFSSGFVANMAVLSCLPVDIILYDEQIHASSHDGMRLSRARHVMSFRHNDVAHLESLLFRFRNHEEATDKPPVILIVVEGMYSMQGDVAPLRRIMTSAEKFNAQVVVDEAHSAGIFGDHGQGFVVERRLETHPNLFCRVITFGKAFGSHGAAVVFNHQSGRDYIMNYARSFVFSTSPGIPWILGIDEIYKYMASADADVQRANLKVLSDYFDTVAAESKSLHWLPCASGGPIKSVELPGNHFVTAVANELRRSKFLVYAVRAPTVPAGSERMRLVIHSFNTAKEIRDLITQLEEVVNNVKKGQQLIDRYYSSIGNGHGAQRRAKL